MKQALLVLGMHRSGTSALAGCLERLGVTLGPHLVPGVAGDNERGFFEHADVIAVHERFLAAHGRTWDDPRPTLRDPLSPEGQRALGEEIEPILERDFDGAACWAVKDPRLCRLAPAWLALLERRHTSPAALVVCRPAAEVAASLARRNGFSAEKSLLLWLDHVLSAERATRGVPRAFLTFEALLADPAGVLAAAGERLGVSWPQPPEAQRSALAAFASPELRHHHGDEPSLDGCGLAELAGRLDGAQRTAAAGREDRALFDRLVAQFLAQAPGFEPVLVEHLHQVAARAAADRAWQVERELDANLAALGRTVDTLGRHGPELQRLGEALQGTRRELGELAGEVSGQGEALTAERRERSAADAGLETSLREGGSALVELDASLQRLDLALKQLGQSVQGSETGRAELEAGLREAEKALAWLAGRLDALERPPAGLASRLAASMRVLRGRPPGGAR